MADEKEFSGLLLPVEHLQDLLEKMDHGVEVAMSDLEKLELKKYIKILKSQMFDDDDDENVDQNLLYQLSLSPFMILRSASPRMIFF